VPSLHTEGKDMIGGVLVSCVESTCAYCIDKRCIADHIAIVRTNDGRNVLTCDTYEHRDMWFDAKNEDPFKDENYAVGHDGKII